MREPLQPAANQAVGVPLPAADPPEEVLEWREFLVDGDRLLAVACRSGRRPRVFTPEIRYNLLAMAVEKHFMALVARHGQLPENHTFSDLVGAARQVTDLDPELAAELLDLERWQNLCPAFDGYVRHAPTPDVLERLTAAALRVQVLARGEAG